METPATMKCFKNEKKENDKQMIKTDFLSMGWLIISAAFVLK